jgi:hypothetical protein
VRLRTHLAVFAACVGLVAVATWPLVRDPARLVPDNTDPRLFTWVMLSVFRNLWAQPGLLLHGGGFYPLGSSLTFAEPLVTPALVAGPLYALTGQPYLAYNLTLVLFWAASGWAMYAVTHAVTGRHAAAAPAAVVFTGSAPRVEYAVEFQMELMFGLPLCLYALVRFLETQRLRHLSAFLVAYWLQAVAVWYFAVILAAGLAVALASYAARRWAGWQPRALASAGLGGVALLGALAPVAWPFFVTRSELGFERSLADARDRSATLASYVATEGTWLRPLVAIDAGHETTLFPGVGAALLAGLAAFWLRGRSRSAGAWPERLLAAAATASVLLALLGVLAAGQPWAGAARTWLPSPTACGVALLGVLMLGHALAGWRRWRAGARERRLAEDEWVALLAGVGVLAFLLSLGPVVRVDSAEAGPGLYAWLHPYVLPLRAIRGTTRFGLLVLCVVAFLAALGMAWLLARLPRRAGHWVAAAALAALLAEYWAREPLAYGRVERADRPVDAAIRADPQDVVVLEWPLNSRMADVDAKLRSVVGHGKRVVNGFAGFRPDFQRRVSGLLSQPGPPFPVPEARVALARIYPLRYVVVRLGELNLPRERPREWRALRAAPPAFLRFRGTFGEDDLWEVVPLPERGVHIERWMAYDFVRTHPVLRLTARPVRSEPGLEQWVAVSLNGRPVARLDLEGPASHTASLGEPLHRALPNVVALAYGYRRGPAAQTAVHAIGATGARSPLDLVVRSGGQPHGDVASIHDGLAERARNRRGYNLAAFDPSGRLVGLGTFDTFGDAGASGRLAEWVGALPPGTIVAGAVKDEASARLDAAAVRALGSLGVGGDLRGRFRASHAFVGVVGAPPGSAIEALGSRPVEVTVGVPPGDAGFELAAFELGKAP